MNDPVVLTLPFSQKTFWILVILLSFIALSCAFNFLGVERAKKGEISADWLVETISGAAGVFAPIWVLLLGLVFYSLWALASDFNSKLTGSDLRWHVLALVGMITALGGLLGAPLALLRVITTERQVKAAEESLVTEQIYKAVEGLAANIEGVEGAKIQKIYL